MDVPDTTAMATETTLLNPRFYTTDFDEMDRIDVTPVRAEWDKLIAQMKSDPNKGHFKKNADWDQIDWEGMDPPLRREFIDFLVSSCTAEFSGCVLYKEMKRRGTNPTSASFSATCRATRPATPASSTTPCARRGLP
jgi:magnesium-protoporphyrin IX monomethyl ester (oxidative) cyclase